MKKTLVFGIAAALSLSLILGACSSNNSADAPAADKAEEMLGEAFDDNENVNPEDAEPVTLRIAVLPIIDTLPMFVAYDEGIFEDFNLDVKFIPVSSAPELSQMIASGQADGMVTDGLTVAFFDKDGTKIQIVRYAQRPSADAGHFFILAAKDSGIRDAEGLKGVEIGISEGTIIEYVTDRLLEKEGFSSADINTIAVPKIPERMALLGSGEIHAAVLPDPLASLAVQQGATIVLDDSQSPEYGASVYVFSKAMIDENPQAVQSFVDAIDIAVGFLASDPEEYASTLTKNKLIPPSLADDFVIPPFPNGVYTREEWADTLAWAQGKGLLNVNIPYEEAVKTVFAEK